MPNSNTEAVGVVTSTRVPDLSSREVSPDVHNPSTKLDEPLGLAEDASFTDEDESAVPSPDIAALITQAIRRPCKRAAEAPLQHRVRRSKCSRDGAENNENCSDIPEGSKEPLKATHYEKETKSPATGAVILLNTNGDDSCDSTDTNLRVPLGCLYEEAEDEDESDDDNEDEVEETDEEDDYSSFNPYAFMKTLPSLEEAVPYYRPPAIPSKQEGCDKPTLVLDLDETLVHSCLDGTGSADFSFEVGFNGQFHTVNVQQRPHLYHFLDSVAQLYEVVIFTASQKVYAEQLLDILDPEGCLIQHRLYRDDCVYVDGNYLKDLTVLGRDLKRTVIVDNSPHAFGFQVDNGIPIESWYYDDSDQELLGLLPLLEQLAKDEDVRPKISETFKTRELIESAGCKGNLTA